MLDLSDVVIDPDFTSTFTVVRRTQTVGSNGIAAINTQTFKAIGVVTNEFRKIEHLAQISEVGAELKAYAKSLEKSNYVRDKRAVKR